MNSIRQYIDPAWFWIYENREQKKTNIIKGLIQFMYKIMSLEELNSLAVICKLPNQRGDEEIR